MVLRDCLHKTSNSTLSCKKLHLHANRKELVKALAQVPSANAARVNAGAGADADAGTNDKKRKKPHVKAPKQEGNPQLRRHPCPNCAKYFANRSNVTRHLAVGACAAQPPRNGKQRRLSREPNSKCPNCAKDFLNRSNVTKHLAGGACAAQPPRNGKQRRVIREPNSNGRYDCPNGCGVDFKCAWNVTNHMQRHCKVVRPKQEEK